MIRCALALIRSPLASMPLARRPSISSVSTRGSTTTPLPMTHSLPGYRIPLGIRWNAHFWPSRTIVWPALLPPWKRTTMSARSASRSTILPLPSSPHWAPTMTMPGIATQCVRRRTCARSRDELPIVQPAGVVAEERQHRAHLLEARHRPRADLGGELPRVFDVRRDDDRALVLVARVDDRVELLEHPRRRVLGADVVDVQEVDGRQAIGEVEVAALAVGLEGRADLGEQARERVDGNAAPGVERGLGDEHRQARLAGPGLAEEPQSVAGVELLVDAADELPHRAHDDVVHVADRRPVERHAAVLARDHGAQPPRAAALQPRWSAPAGRGEARRLVDDEPAAVADVEGAGLDVGHAARCRPRKRGYSFWKVSGTSPSPPLRCLAMISSASPGRSVVSGK